jgi:DNA-binding YbaB/EbfC family protein
MFDKLKTLMEMQKKMQEVKHQLDTTTFEVASTDGILKVIMNGAQETKEVYITADIKEEDKANLQQAIKDVYNRAIKRSHDIAAVKMKDVTGLNLPGLT